LFQTSPNQPGFLGWLLSLDRARLLGLGLALAIHALLAFAIATMTNAPSNEATIADQAISVRLVQPVAERQVATPAPPTPAIETDASPEPAPAAEASAEPAPETNLVQAQPVTEASTQAQPQPAQRSEEIRSEPPAEPAAQLGQTTDRDPVTVLAAPGGQANFALDAPRRDSALRGVVCATGSPETRQAAGCGAAGDSEFGRFTAYAGSQGESQINERFTIPELQAGYSGFTVDFSGRALPGQIFSQHAHFASGVHAASGQLPVAEKARDPGFGD